MEAVRIGVVSSYDEASSTASIFFPDRGSNATVNYPVLAPYGARQDLVKGAYVATVQLENTGIVLGPITAGNTAVTEDLVKRIIALEERVTRLEEEE